jgi:phosphohistidine phosphatase
MVPVQAVRHLWVLRHAKASARSPSGLDHDRPLSGRGRRQMKVVVDRCVGEAVADGAVLPDLVLSSSAERALQTARLVLAACPGSQLDVESGLYQADSDDVVARLRLLDDPVRSVMIVGHNPTVEEVVLLLMEADRRSVFEQQPFTTAALAVLAFGEGTWSQLAAGAGRLVGRYVPEG